MSFPVRPESASASLASSVPLQGQDDYVAFILAGRRELFVGGDAALRHARGDELQQVACELLRAWPASTAKLPTLVEPGSFFYVEMFTSVPFSLAPSPNVTMLGDAVHAMTPSLGRGANVALRDAVHLGRKLIEVERGQSSLEDALASYESEMTRYGFEVVRQSVETGTRVLGQEPLPD
jgi:2-polyprenyl-6-methoxyphenol hydroxylase-like FAD-dependent oxidoreductase